MSTALADQRFSAKTVLVVTSDVPFVRGGHRVIAEQLHAALLEAGHRAEMLTTPSNRFGRSLQAYLATRLTDVEFTGYGEPVDHVISLRYPAYAVRHPHHTAWVIHRMREYYDLWDHVSSDWSVLALAKESMRREVIHRLDRWLLSSNVERLFCISNTVRDRLQRWGDHQATTLHPPPPVRPYRTEGYEPVVFAVSRLHRWKRMHLLVEALVHAPGLRAVIAGDGPEREALLARARELDVADRLQLPGALSDEALLDWYARAAVVFFAPLNEDYGFVTTEAFMSRKPVVTCQDAGGVLDLVQDGVTGFVVAPQPERIAEALTRLVDDPRACEKLGAQAHALASAMSWQTTVDTLLGVQR